MSTEQQSLTPHAQELKAMLSRRLAEPLPESYEGRVEMLEKHLKEVSASVDGAGEAQAAPLGVDQVIMFTRGVSEEVRQVLGGGVLEELSDCDNAAAVGAAAITLGAIAAGGPGAIAGFAFGLMGLIVSCT